MVKRIVLFMSIVLASGILFANVYTSVVDATSWGSNIPESLHAARTYFKVVDPGTFFKMVGPLNQVLTLLAVILCWKPVPSARIYLLTALGCCILMYVLTFTYFYPRNAIMFEGGTDPAVMSEAWSQWNAMNWVRSLIIFVGVCASCVALDKVYLNQ